MDFSNKTSQPNDGEGDDRVVFGGRVRERRSVCVCFCLCENGKEKEPYGWPKERGTDILR